MKLEQSSCFDTLVKNIKKQKSFTITGLTTFSRLLLVKYIQKLSNKKILFITSTEQAALRYSVDLEKIWDIKSVLLPYQNTSPYETIQSNIYDYQKQILLIFISFWFFYSCGIGYCTDHFSPCPFQNIRTFINS